MKKASLLLSLVLLLAALPAWAAPSEFERALEKARKGYGAKNAEMVVSSLRQALIAAWDVLPFTALNVQILAEPPTTPGQLRPRVEQPFKPGEPLLLYMEPVGFVVNRDAQQEYRYQLAADFTLVDSWGRLVGGRRDFARFEGTSSQFPDRMPLNFTYSLSGLAPGEYRVETTLRDLLGKQAHTIIVPLRVEGP